MTIGYIAIPSAHELRPVGNNIVKCFACMPSCEWSLVQLLWYLAPLLYVIATVLLPSLTSKRLRALTLQCAAVGLGWNVKIYSYPAAVCYRVMFSSVFAWMTVVE